jgi:hypothetical protein
MVTHIDLFDLFEDFFEALASVELENIIQLQVLFRKQKLVALDTKALEEGNDHSVVHGMENGVMKFDMTKVAGTNTSRLLAADTDLVGIERTHLLVVDRVVACKLTNVNLRDTILYDLFGRVESEKDTLNFFHFIFNTAGHTFSSLNKENSIFNRTKIDIFFRLKKRVWSVLFVMKHVHASSFRVATHSVSSV